MVEGIIVGDDAAIGESQGLLIVLVEADAVRRNINRINHHPLLPYYLCFYAGLTVEYLFQVEDEAAHVRVPPHHHELSRLVSLVGRGVLRRRQDMEEIPQLTRVNSHDSAHARIQEAIADDHWQADQFVRIILPLLLHLFDLRLFAPVFVGVLPFDDLLERDIGWQAGK